MAETKCPACGETKVVRFGRTASGYQRYLCRNKDCEIDSFQLGYTYDGCKKRIEDIAGFPQPRVFRIRPI